MMIKNLDGRLLLIPLFLAITYQFNIDDPLPAGGYYMCLEYLGEGTLYSGQPFCNQGPLVFYLGYLPYIILGQDIILPWLWIISVICAAVIHIICARIVDAKSSANKFVFSLLYLILVYRFISATASMISTAAMILGFYAMYYTKSKWSGLSAGIMFAASIFSKYTGLLPILGLVCFYPFHKTIKLEYEGRMRIMFRPDRKPFFEAGQALAVCALSYFILISIHPNMMVYTWTGHSGQIGDYGIGKLAGLFLYERTYHLLALPVFTLAILVLAWESGLKRSLHPYIIVYLSFLAHNLLFLFQQDNLKTGTYYHLNAYPFILILAHMALKESKKAFSVLLVALILYHPIVAEPAIELVKGSHNKRFENARDIIEGGMMFIPEQRGRILTEWDDFLSFKERFSLRVDDSRVRIYSPAMGSAHHEDAAWAPQLRRAMNISESHNKAFETSVDEEEDEISSEILGGEYSMILIGPPKWALLNSLVRKNLGYIRENYCQVSVPNFMYRGEGRTHTTILFENPRHCVRMKKDMNDYYNSKFDTICGYGKKPAAVVSYAMAANGISFNRVCESKELLDSDFLPSKYGLSDAVILLFSGSAIYYLVRYGVFESSG